MLTQPNAVSNAIEKFESKSDLAEKNAREGVLPTEEIDNRYEELAGAAERIIELMNNPNNVYKFIKEKGIDRVIVPNLANEHDELRTQLLILIKILFDVAPTTTTVMMPVSVVDRLLDIFENDFNSGIKAHAFDILYSWLPGNPKIQARVMKMKGLEPFYRQITYLDASVVYKILDLFNKILVEHVTVRNDITQRTKADMQKLDVYKKIGLIERVSTTTVCRGLLTIFRTAFEYNNKDEEIMIPVFDIIKNIKPYCLNLYKGSTSTYELFENLLKYVQEVKERAGSFKEVGLNVNEAEAVLREYVDILKEHVLKQEL